MGWLSLDLLSMILVGALWGCTNPLLRKGSVEASSSDSETTTLKSKNTNQQIDDTTKSSTSSSFLISTLKSFLNIKVWLPYVLNQSGSLVFYVLLANSDLSMAVPICNAIALIFSFVTSYILGEPIHKPIQTLLGSSLILIGVTICISSSHEEPGQPEEEQCQIVVEKT